MGYNDAKQALQSAFRAKILASTALQALLNGRVYDAPPPTPSFPHVLLGDMGTETLNFMGTADCILIVTHRVYVVYKPAPGMVMDAGYQRAREVSQLVGDLFHRQPLTLTGSTRKVDYVSLDDEDDERTDDTRALVLVFTIHLS